MKLRVALLALVSLTVVAVGNSQATVNSVTVTLGNLTSSAESASGTTLTYGPGGTSGGSFDVTVVADAAPDTIASVDFPTVPGMTGGGLDSTSPFVMTYHWTASTTATGDQTITVTDSTAATKDATFTLTVLPTVKNAEPTEVSGANDQYWAAATNTLWFRPTASGSFKLNATATNAASVTFPDVSTVAGWAGATGGVVTTPFTSPVYSWSSGAAAPGAKALTATSAAGGTATAPVTISGDSTAPSGQSVTLAGGPWFGGSVSLTVAAGTDAGSGVDASRSVVERAGATLTNGACGVFGAFAAVTLSGTTDSSTVSGNCYRYRSKATDNVGNVSPASQPSGDAKVDATAPTTPSLLFTGFSNAAASGGTVYYRPGGSGSFTVTAASSDPQSGVASYSFPSVPGFTPAGSGPHRTYVAAKAGTTSSGPLSVSATNAAGLSSGAATFSLVPDASAPTVSVRCNGAACRTKPYARTVVVTFSAADVGSGVDTIRWTSDGSDPKVDHGNEYARGIPLTGLTHLKVRAFDKAGNPSALVALTVSSLASRLLVAAPAAVVVKAKGHFVQARVRTTRRALVTATMSGKGLKKAMRWHFVLPSGTSVVKLRLPKTLERPGSYRVVWSVSADSRKAKKTTRVTLR
ncbi:MAG TPA: FN3 associated domain-containing protein [Gaiellaceae bacterium]